MDSDKKGSWGNRLRENLGYAAGLAASLKEEQSSPTSRLVGEEKKGNILSGGTMAPRPSRGDGVETKSREEPTTNDSETANQGRSVLHSLFSDAAETWIQGQTSNESDIPGALPNSSFEHSSHDYEGDEDNDSDSSDSCTQSSMEDVAVSLDNMAAVKSNLTMASTREMENKLSSLESFDTNTSLGTRSHGSLHSTKSVEIEMATDFHGSWTTVGPDSQMSSSFSSSDNATKVYIRDEQFCWLPATVLEYQKDSAFVAVDLPDTWTKSTVTMDQNGDISLFRSASAIDPKKKLPPGDIENLASEYNVPVNTLRQVWYKDYEQGDLPKQNIQGNGKRNMEDLFFLHPAAILYNLKERHYLQKPYTRVGDILIAMNPFVWIRELYLPDTRDLYSRNLIWNATQEEHFEGNEFKEKQNIYDRLGFDPHVYEVSALAYRGLAQSGQDQTILVTGESGAGKTETVKIVMDHLATVQLTRPGGVEDEHNASKDIVDRVIKSSPVFEAFGNAKTVRNNNSSRFGKFIQLQFRVEPIAVAQMGGREVPYTDLVGSKVSTYLLEKNRVVFHADGERTFHVFYQLLAAPVEFKKQIWPFFPECGVSDFKYTAEREHSSCEDGKLWHETKEALGLFKFRNDSLLVLMQALGIVLQLGNLVFVEDDSVEHHQASIISSKHELHRLSSMIGIPEEDLQETMTSRVFKTPASDAILVKLTPAAAKEACDALAKEIYSRIFDLVVGRINEFTEFPEAEVQRLSTLGHISLLDIFGFERFEVNRFEQLCINYTNEKLHHKFVIDNFNQVQSEYIDEGVDLFDFKLVDNSDTLQLLEGRHGVIVTLNEECLLPKGRDESFVYKMKKHQKSTKLIDKKLHRPFEFGIEHFAGTVKYDSRNFVQTNMDKLPDNLVVTAGRSTNSLIKDEFRKLMSQRVVHGEGSKTSNKKKNEANKTVMHKFQLQLKELIAAMDGTRTRYIRCIKANTSMVPKLTDHLSTMKQLECSGLMTALIISRESFPQKLTYDFILNRYACLMGDEKLQSATIDMAHQDRVRHVLSKWLKHLSKKNRDGTRTMPFACGKTKVFFKPGAQDCLECLRRQFYERSSRTIQTWFRGIIAVKLLAQRRRSVYKIQAFSRMALVKIHIEKQRLASTILCAWIRCRWAVVEFRTKRARAVVIQNATRRWKQMAEFHRIRAGVVLLQSIVRMAIVRMKIVRFDFAATVISQWIRRYWYLNEIKRQHSARRIQRLWRSYSIKSSFDAEIRAIVNVQRAWRRCLLRRTLLSKPKVELSVTKVKTSPKDETWSSSLSLNSTDSDSISMPLRSIEIQQNSVMNDIDSIFGEKLALQKKLLESSQREKIKTKELEELQSTFKRRVADLTKANNGLVNEVFKLRQECDLAKKQRRLDALQMESQFAKIQEEMERTCRKYEKKIHSMERNTIDAQRRFDEEIRSKRKEISTMEQRHSDYVEKLRDELRNTQVSHQEYLGKLMNILETTQTMREKETAKINADLRAIKKEKDGQIFMLQQELKAARAAKGIVINDVEPRPLIDAHGMKKEFLEDADEIAVCSQEFNDTVEKLTNLIAASHTLPPAVGPHNMTEVAQQQERAQRMMECVGVLIDLYSLGEERQTSRNERSLAAVDDYIALSDPDEAIRDLQERLADAELQNERLRNELQEKGYCRKCAVREEAARRRLGK